MRWGVVVGGSHATSGGGGRAGVDGGGLVPKVDDVCERDRRAAVSMVVARGRGGPSCSR